MVFGIQGLNYIEGMKWVKYRRRSIKEEVNINRNAQLAELFE